MHVPRRVIRPQSKLTEWLAKASLPTRHGSFETHVFRSAPDEEGNGLPPEHVALVFGDVRGKQDVLVRVHSECMTSEVFGSLKCDCKEQLETAMAGVAHAGAGAVLYLRQEGRGIGLANKIRAYALQSSGHDTVDANRLLGLPDDARRYDVARDMVEHLGIESVRLLTNNPAKVAALRGLGVRDRRKGACRRGGQRPLRALLGSQTPTDGARPAGAIARGKRRRRVARQNWVSRVRGSGVGAMAAALVPRQGEGLSGPADVSVGSARVGECHAGMGSAEWMAVHPKYACFGGRPEPQGMIRGVEGAGVGPRKRDPRKTSIERGRHFYFLPFR